MVRVGDLTLPAVCTREGLLPRVHIVDHPYAQELLGVLRDKGTGCDLFRSVLEEVGYILALEIAKTLETQDLTVETPLGVKTKAIRLKRDGLVLLAIARAGIPLAHGMLKAFKHVPLGVAVARRIEEPGKPIDAEVSYINAPCAKTLIVADPMIATGATISKVLTTYYTRVCKPKRVIIAGVIAVKQGINRISQVEPNAEFYVLAVDPQLNDKGFIVPGLGDAGDRSYCTETVENEW